LVLSGGVIDGKYDLVEQVLATWARNFILQASPYVPAGLRCLRRAGEACLRAAGNPVSTMVTFELLCCPPLFVEWCGAAPLPVFRGKLATPVHEKGPMTHFLPARIEWEGRRRESRIALARVRRYRCAGRWLTASWWLARAAGHSRGRGVDVLPRRGAV